MDWALAISRNRAALKRILIALVAMAGLGDAAAFTSPLWGGRREAAGGGSAPIPTPTRRSDDRRPPHKGEVDPARPMLPRRLHRACLRLLRPAEAAARRLIIVAARGLTVTLPPPRPRKAELANRPGFTLNRRGNPVPLPRRGPIRKKSATRLSLPLFDTLPALGPRRRRTTPPHRAPRISGLDGALAPAFAAPGRVETRRTLPPPPQPDDPIDAARLKLRIEALAVALDDLPGQARRFARCQAIQARIAASRDRPKGRHGPHGPPRRIRLTPLRPGRPPGSLRRPTHEVHEVLADLNVFAVRALERPNTR